ncbi:3-deoxy-7-phosphoheptulonate synthase class II [Streptomyces syringium]|uniref:3-deoxy-7-phosphoheptulonate synthase class II n=1 Tax=Streptomyces syringium TaxID=76729 RepID=UPI0034482D6F
MSVCPSSSGPLPTDTAEESWTPASWRAYPAAQQPEWPDRAALDAVVEHLAQLPPLVGATESARLHLGLSAAAQGNAFLLQAGDCAEVGPSFHAGPIFNKVKLILQMATIISLGSGLPVVKVGRIASQVAKPRSSGFDSIDGLAGPILVPSYRGEMINGTAATAEARRPDETRLLRSYYQSAATLNFLRMLSAGDLATLSEGREWNGQHVQMDRAARRPTLHHRAPVSTERSSIEFYTSHEALVLPYEQGLTRWNRDCGGWYNCSAHTVWIGDRTRQIGGAHIEFAAGIGNPIGVKIGPSIEPSELLAICQRLAPKGIPGRLALISRMGPVGIRKKLPHLVRAVQDAGYLVLWVCDPMHGNTFTDQRSGLKTRRFEDIEDELRGFFEVHYAEGTHPGGIHLELTGENVTECIGGSANILSAHLSSRYESACDPRLNEQQALDLALIVAELLQSGG